MLSIKNFLQLYIENSGSYSCINKYPSLRSTKSCPNFLNLLQTFQQSSFTNCYQKFNKSLIINSISPENLFSKLIRFRFSNINILFYFYIGSFIFFKNLEYKVVLNFCFFKFDDKIKKKNKQTFVFGLLFENQHS